MSKEVHELEIPELTICYMSDVSDNICCKIQIEASVGNMKCVDLIVNTGSSVSILPKQLYEECFAECLLTEPKVRLVTYSKDKISVLGCMPALVMLGKVTTSATFYIVQAGSVLLGLDLIKALNYQFAERTVGTIPPAPVYETDKESSSAIGCVKGFIHKVQVNPNFPPVQQKLRRLPLCV